MDTWEGVAALVGGHEASRVHRLCIGGVVDCMHLYRTLFLLHYRLAKTLKAPC
jgi:hypothetical protein